MIHVSLVPSVCFCSVVHNRRWPSQRVGAPLPDWVHTERGSFEGLPQWALFWWVSPTTATATASACSSTLHQRSGLNDQRCPLLVRDTLCQCLWRMKTPGTVLSRIWFCKVYWSVQCLSGIWNGKIFFIIMVFKKKSISLIYNTSFTGSLTALVCQHSITPLALPCKLIIPDKGKNNHHTLHSVQLGNIMIRLGDKCYFWPVCLFYCLA